MRELPARIRRARGDGNREQMVNEQTRRARIIALGALGAAFVATLGVVSLASGGESTAEPTNDAAYEQFRSGVRLNKDGRHRQAIAELKGAMLAFDGQAPERVLGKANFELGVALRQLGKFEAAQKPLNRSRLFGVSAAAVGDELTKAREGIR